MQDMPSIPKVEEQAMS